MSVALRPAFGYLEMMVLSAREPLGGAVVLVGGREAGRTAADGKLRIERVASARHLVEVRADLHETWAQEVDVMDGLTTRRTVDLVPDWGTLVVRCDVAGARVSVPPSYSVTPFTDSSRSR